VADLRLSFCFNILVWLPVNLNLIHRLGDRVDNRWSVWSSILKKRFKQLTFILQKCYNMSALIDKCRRLETN
jgi:hypothetical protein